MKNFSVLFTGISGSGKTTLANKVYEKLKKDNISSYVLDGDEIRNEMGNLFGYTKDERMKNNQVVRMLIKILLKNNINTLVTLVAPYQEMRDNMKKEIGDAYIEVYVQCPYEECAKRDVKGYYKKALNGEIENLNGANDKYEIPLESDIIVHTDKETVEESADKVVKYLNEILKNNIRE